MFTQKHYYPYFHPINKTFSWGLSSSSFHRISFFLKDNKTFLVMLPSSSLMLSLRCFLLLLQMWLRKRKVLFLVQSIISVPNQCKFGLDTHIHRKHNTICHSEGGYFSMCHFPAALPLVNQKIKLLQDKNPS